MFKRTEKHITDSEAIKNLPHNRKEAFFDLLTNFLGPFLVRALVFVL